LDDDVKEIIDGMLESRPSREDLLTRNILQLNELEAVYWGPFAVHKNTKTIMPDVEFVCTIVVLLACK
jgi:hypothetical protein